jgi:hypothetical protein
MSDNLTSDNFHRRINKNLVEKYLKEGKRVQYYTFPCTSVPAYWADIPQDHFENKSKEGVDAFLNGCGPFRVVEIHGAELIDDLEKDDFNSSMFVSMNGYGTIAFSVFNDLHFDPAHCYYIDPTRSGIDNAKRIAKVLTAWADNIEMCGLIEKEEV